MFGKIRSQQQPQVINWQKGYFLVFFWGEIARASTSIQRDCVQFKMSIDVDMKQVLCAILVSIAFGSAHGRHADDTDNISDVYTTGECARQEYSDELIE